MFLGGYNLLVLIFDYVLFVQVYEFVGLTELYYAGSHGMDIMGPIRQSILDDHANCFRSTDKQVICKNVTSNSST